MNLKDMTLGDGSQTHINSPEETNLYRKSRFVVTGDEREWMNGDLGLGPQQSYRTRA